MLTATAKKLVPPRPKLLLASITHESSAACRIGLAASLYSEASAFGVRKIAQGGSPSQCSPHLSSIPNLRRDCCFREVCLKI